ncbi:MAG: cytochrome c [Alphaproteobacteria bacterium]|nr:cytochrome c [Alphaproteobacteria bacterium]
MSSSRPIPTLLVALAALAASAAPAFAAGDAAAGRRTADTWCVGCHLIGNEQKAALVDAPTFPEINKRMTPEALRAYLFQPHPPMPQFRLTRQDIEDLIEFIQSMEKK